MFLPLSIPEEFREFDKNSEDNKKLLKNCIYGILVLSQNKQTIKKTDLNKLIYVGMRSGHHTTTKAVMAHANHHLNKYMGMRLFDLNDNRGYLLVNTTSEMSNFRKDFNKEQCDELAVIFLTLMEIFTSADESSTEDQIRNVLAALDIKEEDIKKHFDMLQKKLYIVAFRDPSCLQDGNLYMWGPRAIAEVDPEKFMKSFLELAEEGTVDDWPDQKRRIEVLKAVPNR